MSYRCEICTAAVPHGKPMRRHTIYRLLPATTVERRGIDGSGMSRIFFDRAPERKQVVQEIPVCEECERRLRTEYLSDLLAAHRPGPERLPPIPARPPKPVRPAVVLVVTPPPPVTAVQVPSGLSTLYTPDD